MSHSRVIPPPAGPDDLRSARRDRGLTVAELAKAAEVAPAVVRRAERGVMPRPANAKRIAEFFGVRVSELWPDPTPQQNDPAALGTPGVMTSSHQEAASAHER